MSSVDLDEAAAAEQAEAEPIPVEVIDSTGQPAERPSAGTAVEVIEPAASSKTAAMIPGTDLSIVPVANELRDLAQLATTLAYADAVPKALRGKPNDVLLVFMSARDLRVALSTALREFHVIDGRVTISPKAKLAMVRQAGLGRIWPDPGNDDKSATWYATRNDMPHDLTFSATFTMAMAETAGLVKKDNWKGYPARMLSWRAVGYLMDDVFGEVATGLYSPDELGAVTDEQGVPLVNTTDVGVLPGMNAGRPRGGSKRASGGEPDDPPATAEEIADIERRIAAIADHHPDARKALLAIWTQRDEHDLPKLPAPPALMRRHLAMAKGMLATIEARIGKGEWEAQNATSEPTQPPAAIGTGGDAPAADEPDADAETATDLNVLLAEVDGWDRKTLDEQCKALGVPVRGAAEVVKERYRVKLTELAEQDGAA